jgi:hypothetical protein
LGAEERPRRKDVEHSEAGSAAFLIDASYSNILLCFQQIVMFGVKQESSKRKYYG